MKRLDASVDRAAAMSVEFAGELRRRALRTGGGSLLAVWAGLSTRSAQGAVSFDHRYGAWDALLRRFVAWQAGGVAATVDYRGLLGARAELQAILDAFSGVSADQYAGFRRDEKLAFLINVYNAFTLALILTRYPELKSIRDLGSLIQSPWKRRFFRLFGEERSLDHVEHELIRAPGVFDDPRIHFVVVCASVGCPALRPEALIASQLDAQMEDSTQRFLRDRSRNRFNIKTGKLEVSKLFDWYKGDFDKPFRGSASREAFLGRYAESLADDPREQQLIRQGRQPVTFLDYDWSLNDRR